MQRFLSDLPLFVEVAKWKSFTRAAEALAMPLPTLSRRIAGMEASLGLQLFRRNKRKVELTEAGESFFERCEFVVAEARGALENLLEEQCNPTGRLRIALPATSYYTLMQGAFSSFMAKYPGIEMHVSFSTRWVDLYSEPYDVDIRTGKLPDSDLIVRRLYTFTMGIYAAKTLLERFPAPATPPDLTALPYIHMCVLPRYSLDLRRGEEAVSVPMRPTHVVNAQALGLEFLLAGQGIAAVDLDTAERYEASSEIVRLLPEWTVGEIDVSLVRASGKSTRRVQLFVEHMAGYFKKLRQGQTARPLSPRASATSRGSREPAAFPADRMEP